MNVSEVLLIVACVLFGVRVFVGDDRLVAGGLLALTLSLLL